MNNLTSGMLWCAGVMLMALLGILIIVGVFMTIRFINSWLNKRGW